MSSNDEHFEALPPLATPIEVAEPGARELAVAARRRAQRHRHARARAASRPTRAPNPGVSGSLSSCAAPRLSFSRALPSGRAIHGSRSAGASIEAYEAIQRVFGKGRSDVKPRETKDLLRELERLLGERRAWTAELSRSLFDVIAPKHRARRRSADHERVYWMLSGFCLRPGCGHPLDVQRIALIAPLFSEGLAFGGEPRGWQQFFIAWRRVAGGLTDRCSSTSGISESVPGTARSAAEKAQRLQTGARFSKCSSSRPASSVFRPSGAQSSDAGSSSARSPVRDPRLWAATRPDWARVPAYASAASRGRPASRRALARPSAARKMGRSADGAARRRPNGAHDRRPRARRRRACGARSPRGSGVPALRGLDPRRARTAPG